MEGRKEGIEEKEGGREESGREEEKIERWEGGGNLEILVSSAMS